MDKNAITRRSLLKAAPGATVAAVVALGLTAGMAEASAGSATIESLALQFRDAAKALDPSITGAWMLTDEIMDGPREMRVIAVYLERPHAPMIRHGKPVNPSARAVDQAIREHKRAWKAFGASCPAADKDEPCYGGPDAEALNLRNSRAEDRAYIALLATGTSDPKAAAVKARYVKAHIRRGFHLEARHLNALLGARAA